MAGEMSQYDTEPGGDWYEDAQQLRRAAMSICRRLRWRVRLNGVHPFDQYQGPFAQMTNGRLWFTEYPGIYYHAGIDETGTVEELANIMKGKLT